MSNQLFLEVGRRSSFWRRGVWTLIYVVLILVVVCAGPALFVGWRLTHPAALEIAFDAASIGQDVRTVSFESTDGIPLEGWFVPAVDGMSESTVIFAHGYAGHRVVDEPAAPLAKAVTENGLNALLFDFRNSGRSGRGLTTVGIDEVRDLQGAVRYLSNGSVWDGRVPGRRVGLVGFSMGAVASIVAARDEPRVRVVVADSPFADLRRYLQRNLSKWTHLPSIPFDWILLSVMPTIAGIDMDADQPLDVVAAWGDRPLLIVHGTDDGLVPIANSEQLIQAAPDGANVTLWRVSGAGHVGAYRVDAAGYRSRALNLLVRSLAADE